MQQQQYPGPFEQHLREAIRLNQTRLPLYKELDKLSLPILRQVIFLEKMLILPARYFDHRARPYHQAGIGLLKDLFVSMDLVPVFRSSQPAPSAPETSYVFSYLSLRQAYQKNGLIGALPVLESSLQQLAMQPCFNCMLRHLLESMQRLCQLAPIQIAAAKTIKLKPPANLLKQLFQLHLWGLRQAGNLDVKAVALQVRGIPILCQDLPSIPSYKAKGHHE